MFDLFTKWNIALIGGFIAISCLLVWLCRRARQSPYSDLGRFGGILLGHLTDHSTLTDIGPKIVWNTPHNEQDSAQKVRVKRRRHRFTKPQRQYLARRQNYKCNHCGIDLGARLIDCDVDHIIPLSQNGKDWPHISNLEYLCTYCHRLKTKKENRNFKRCS